MNDAQRTKIAPLLPGKAADPGRSGAHWCDPPQRYGTWKTVHQHFSRWCHAGVWKRVFAAPSADRGNQYLMIDNTIVRAHQQVTTGKEACDQALRRSRGAPTTNIHVLADALAGRCASSSRQAPALLHEQDGTP